MTPRLGHGGAKRGASARRSLAALALLLALAPAGPALAQASDDIDEPSPPAPNGPASRAASAELNAALVRLGRDPRNVSALVDAGQAALHMGDTQAALGFFTRADQVSPGNARIKTQIGSALVLANEPTEAVKYFDAAESANADLTSFALDRGLAYDLLGDNRQAQGWYQVALSRGVNEEATLRYAISLAISHDFKTAETLLAPLIQQQDRAAWRVRTFALAINGDDTQAIAISRVMMPAPLAEGIAPYLRYMPRLTRAQQAAAANLGHFPRAADIGHDDSRIMAYAAAHPEIGRGLVPVGAPLGTVANADDAKVSRAKRRRPGQVDSDAAQRAVPAKTTLAQAATAPPAYVPPPASANSGPAIPVPAVRSVLDGPPAPRAAPPRIKPTPAPAAVTGIRPTPAPAAVAVVKPVPAPTPTAVTRADPPPTLPRRTVVAAAPTPVAPAALSQPAPTPKPVPPVATAASRPAPLVPAPAATVVAGAAPAPRLAAGSTFDLARLDASRSTTGAPAPAAAPPVPTVAPAAQAALVPSAAPSAAPTAAPATALATALAAAPTAAPTVAPTASSPPAATAPAAPDFGAAFGSFTPPPAERETAVAAVDLSKIKPVRRRPGKAAEAAPVVEEPAPTTLKGPTTLNGRAALKARLKARGERPDGPAASRSEDDETVTVARGAKLGPKARKAALAAEAEAAAKKAGAKGKGKRGAPANPSRIWVQLLTAPNRDALPKEWTRIAKQAPAMLRGKRGWVTPWGRNYRLLLGPYASEDDAQDALNDLTKAKVRGFVWTSPAGQAIDHLGDEE